MVFEDKIITNIIHDQQYAFKVLPYTKPEYFDQDYQVIIDQILKYFTEYGTTPTKDELIIEINGRKGLTDDQVKRIGELIQSYRIDDSDRQWLIKSTEQFYQQRSLYNAIIGGAQILEKKNQNTNQILKMVQDALSVSFDSNLGHDYFNDSALRYQAYHEKEDKIPTGMSCMDAITLGGFSRKSLNCVMAASGCHDRSTNVVMGDGTLCNVTRVQVGDVLKGYNDTYRTVLQLVRGVQQMYTITPQRNLPFTVNADHILVLKHCDTHEIVEITVARYLKQSHEFKSHYLLFSNDVPCSFQHQDHVFVPMQCDEDVEIDINNITFDTLGIGRRYLLGSITERYQYLNNILDQIGYQWDSYYQCTVRHYNMAYDIARLAGSLGINYRIEYNCTEDIQYYHINLYCNHDNNVRSNNHKPWVNISDCTIDNHLMSFTITDAGIQPYYGFVLDGDHLYYTDNWIVQHNCGKSLYLVSNACNVVRAGYNALYITLEMSEVRIAERVDANMLHTTIPSLSHMDVQTYTTKLDSVRQSNIGKLIIKEFPTSTASVLHFKNLLNELRLKHNFVPDIIFVDYINLMTSSRYKAGQVNSYGMVKAVSEELRGLAVEYNVAIVTATQTNRSGMNSSDIEVDQISDSIGLVFTLDMLFALIRTEALDQSNMIMLKQLKNRYSDLNNRPIIELGINRDYMKIFDLNDQQCVVDHNQFVPDRLVVPEKSQKVSAHVYQNKPVTPKNDFSKFTF